MPVLLRVENLSKHYGGLRAVNDLSFSVQEGEVLGVVGPNGAGKTTLFDVLSGVVRPTEGSFWLGGRRASNLGPDVLCRAGLVRTFQTSVAFDTQTVFRNALVGTLFGASRDMRDKAAFARAHEALAFVGLADKRNVVAGRLDVLDRKRLMLASALATSPRVLLLDELMGGLTREEMLEMGALVEKVNDSGVTVLIIEHIMEAVLRLSTRIVALHHGEKVFSGTPREFVEDARVRRVYLGLPEAEAPVHAEG